VDDPEMRRELEATVDARRELGAAHDDELIDGFLERLDRRLAQRSVDRSKDLQRRREHQKELILGAMGISVPLFALAAIFTGLAGVIVVAAVLAVIALAVSRSP
jgi:hypothetical protein